ncbi:hypothetical protein EGW08_005426 [Elysia chlorotica]|uniref:Uncharacterized protein n=1 Tax=Elysia chlorotica TaxID=188477 RepID=A0A3S1BRD5_ELYCH|nr:hypothetical protein EGW08_005426 [Elysia chlorotica]
MAADMSNLLFLLGLVLCGPNAASAVTRMSAEEPVRPEPTAFPLSEASTSLPNFSEASKLFPTTEFSTLLPTTRLLTTRSSSALLPTTESSTLLPTTESSTLLPTTESSTLLPTTESSTLLPTTESSTLFPTTDFSTLLPTTEFSTLLPTTEFSTLLPTTESSTLLPTTEFSTLLPTTEFSTLLPTTESSTLLPTTESSTLAPTNQSSTLLPTTESTELPTTEFSTLLPPAESTVQETVPQSDYRRTVIFIKKTTNFGESVFLRGGMDNKPIPIRHRPLAIRGETRQRDIWAAGDNYLDWYDHPEVNQVGVGDGGKAKGTPAQWTTNKSYGNFFHPLNIYGDHYWIVDVMMDCSKTDNGFFEFKGIMQDQTWEGGDALAHQCQGMTSLPKTSNNHIASCGKINVFFWGTGLSCEVKDFL